MSRSIKKQALSDANFSDKQTKVFLNRRMRHINRQLVRNEQYDECLTKKTARIKYTNCCGYRFKPKKLVLFREIQHSTHCFSVLFRTPEAIIKKYIFK